MGAMKSILDIAYEAQQNEQRKDKLAGNLGLTRKSLDMFQDHLQQIISTAHDDR